jgi:hypothetical protein
VNIAGVDYALFCGGPGLVIEGPAFVTESSSVDCNPFLATFPGALLGATVDLVVTKA